ncbi:hypothetical protein KKF84_13855 [Myxococcota bacterium]|nr:hypothetical protein [Myxococcota bacterium]
MNAHLTRPTRLIITLIALLLLGACGKEQRSESNPRQVKKTPVLPPAPKSGLTLSQAQQRIDKLIAIVKKGKFEQKLSTLLATEAITIPKSCDAGGPFDVVTFPKKLPAPERATARLVPGAVPLPGFFAFPLIRHGCAASYGTPCFISYVREKGQLSLKVVAVKTPKVESNTENVGFRWKSRNGCLQLEVSSSGPLECNRPGPSHDYLEILGYWNGTFTKLLPTITTKIDSDYPNSAYGEQSVEWRSGLSGTYMWMEVTDIPRRRSGDEDVDDESKPTVDLVEDNTTNYVLTPTCGLRKANEADKKRIKKALAEVEK